MTTRTLEGLIDIALADGDIEQADRDALRGELDELRRKGADYDRHMFTARQELYRMGKAHAVELQRLREHIATMGEQKRQAVMALGFEDPDKYRT